MIKGEGKYILKDISFVTPRSTLTAICGQVGSGKSTLLCAIAGQLNLSSGTVQFPRPLVYVPQVPWLFSGTIQENILFSAPYNPEWYSTVVEACALKEDIELFPDADETIIGQKGVALSGGQKARVSLARAVYSCADVYILDDPLSAVDQKVGDQIFEECICGLLGDKITVLVSHHSQYLQKADQIVVLDNGRVKEILTPKLSQTNGADEILSNSVIAEFEDEDSPRSKSPSEKSQGLEIPEEDRVIGNLSFRLYWDYFRSGLHPVLLIGLIVLSLLIQPALIFPDIWLSHLSKKTLKQQQKFDNLVIYSSAIAVSLLLATIRVALFFVVTLRASERLHNKMVKAVLHAKLLFFDTNPTGRILNRFSRDIGCLDEQLPQFSILCIQYLLFVLSGALIPAFANPWLLLVLFPISVVFGLFIRYYLKTSRELKRLESICRSPVFSHFSETMAGLDTIRTRGMEEEFVEEFYRHQDMHNQAFIMVFESSRWFSLRVDSLCVIFLVCVALASVGFAMDPAIAGLSLTYVMESLGTAQFGTRYFSEVENFMTSVERVMTYANLEPEPGYKTEALPPTNWPRDGNVTFRDVNMTYYEGGPQVLKEMSFSIEGKSRIGVVGRTGAGKSSVVAALLRMPDAQGDVIIDGIRINDINLQASRRCISVLGQVPTLFSGSLRRNIDPMDQHEDANVWAALEDVQLKLFVESLSGQLDYELLERGANLSVGERQLVCLARTLLQNNRIVILDEPTAHVDPITEQTIWKTVHEKLKNCTVITIAHRLDTIKDCGMVLVVREGEVAEFGTFDSLVGMEGGVLAGIVQTAKDS
ncbi:PREDICTED: multidrug resistance-associated protein 4-like [Acropora digitifera]|uniref:multidrug resistance-associated protein 4-like n=1 Tax=Acropora digitifera TaxID=70779 RepID=UPI00077A836D|nr:PREDICTED: multidrug resistance-associated protein 4-like [Acropora digitifera]